MVRCSNSKSLGPKIAEDVSWENAEGGITLLDEDDRGTVRHPRLGLYKDLGRRQDDVAAPQELRRTLRKCAHNNIPECMRGRRGERYSRRRSADMLQGVEDPMCNLSAPHSALGETSRWVRPIGRR